MHRPATPILCLLALIPTLSWAALTPIDPAPREGDAELKAKWMAQHTTFVQRAKQGGIDALFLGDSITHRWPRPLLASLFPPLKTDEFGIEGEQVQHLLWRLQNGELEGITPKVVVILIGTNNVPRPFSSAQIALTVRSVVSFIRQKSPATKILVMGLFPRNELASNIMRDRISLINLDLARLDDGTTVRFLDIGSRLTDADGTISKDVMPDYLHLSENAYKIWAEALKISLHDWTKPL